MPDHRERARELAAEFVQKGDPTGWFEVLYQEAEQGKSIVPWADGEPNSQLVEFWKAQPPETKGKSALVIARGREKTDPEGQLPWPLTRDELDGFVGADLTEESFEDFADPEPPWVRRFRVLYKRPNWLANGVWTAILVQ